jgi:endonuclease/exonuclease/phosphatase family metal-dependent hydrolase
MKLKVATWNMAHWTHAPDSRRAWEFLDREVSADILLVQEALPPADRRNERCVWRAIGGSRRWGSGVLTNQLPLTEVPLERNDYPGCLTVAEVALPDGSSLVAVSIYGILDNQGYSITTLHRMLSDLTHLLEGKLRSGGRPAVILAGDLNASSQFDDNYGSKSHRIFFERLKAFGLIDCQGPFTNDRPRTLRHNRSEFPWVNDYVFASEKLARKVTEHVVIEKPETVSLSDHNPVVVTFDL